MEWTEKDQEALLTFKDAVDCDEIKIKQDIKKMLLNNKFIMHVLANKELEDDEDTEPEDYFGVNVLDYYMIPEIQSNAKVFLCYEVGYEMSEQYMRRYGTTMKRLEITFHILCYKDLIEDTEVGVARHDLLAALVLDQFNFNPNFRGGRIKCMSDVAGMTDNDYATRTLVFRQTTDNGIVKTKDGITKFSNKDAPDYWNEDIDG